MPTNKYFNNFSYAREQDLIEDLNIEAIKVYGHEVKYLPRTLLREDALFSEDTLSTFNDAIGIEMYIKNVEGFEGEGDLLSKFNLEIRDSMTFTVARKRFDQAKSEKLTTEVGYNYVQEEANTAAPSRRFLDESTSSFSIQLEEGTADNYAITHSRPREGDLIFFELMHKLYEIKHVEHENIFYQSGRLQTYDLRCELFQYSSEKIDTGNTIIDAVETENTMDLLENEFLLDLASGSGKMLNEDGDSLLVEFRMEDVQPTANNEYFASNQDSTINSDSIIDFSERNPFGDIDRF